MIVQTQNARYRFENDFVTRTEATHHLPFDGHPLEVVRLEGELKVGHPISMVLRDPQGSQFRRKTTPVTLVLLQGGKTDD